MRPESQPISKRKLKMTNVEITERTIEPDTLQAVQELLRPVREPEASSRVDRRLTVRSRLEHLEAQNRALREALTQVNESVQRGAVLIAKLHRSMPGAKEVIDAHLAAFGIETKK